MKQERPSGIPGKRERRASTKQIVAAALDFVAEKRAQGWTRDDFAAGLGEMLRSPAGQVCDDIMPKETHTQKGCPPMTSEDTKSSLLPSQRQAVDQISEMYQQLRQRLSPSASKVGYTSLFETAFLIWRETAHAEINSADEDEADSEDADTSAAVAIFSSAAIGLAAKDAALVQNSLVRFTDAVRRAMQLANQEAQRFNHEYVGTEHILLGLVKGTGSAVGVLLSLNVDLRKIRLEVEKVVQAGPGMITMGRLPHTTQATRALAFAIKETDIAGAACVTTAHVLLGLLLEETGLASNVLTGLGCTVDKCREQLRIAGDKNA